MEGTKVHQPSYDASKWHPYTGYINDGLQVGDKPSWFALRFDSEGVMACHFHGRLGLSRPPYLDMVD
ncbi:hypothetical protein HAX54_030860, partial [Datura stramonium]|nr:hypothetical protein [Datura stramonium]